jgi:RNA polymerase sigma-70 factor (ECF subfamily)
MTEETDVIRRVVSGDTESFRLLLERYERPVIRMIRNITGNEQVCEDLAQEVFLAAYTKLKTFDPARSRFSTWLFTIARNKAVNAAKKKRPVSLADPPQHADLNGPVDAAARQEFLDRFDNALLTLPPKLRSALVLAEFEQLPYEEIAQIEGVRLGTIKSRIHRARNRLMKTLGCFKADRP